MNLHTLVISTLITQTCPMVRIFRFLYLACFLSLALSASIFHSLAITDHRSCSRSQGSEDQNRGEGQHTSNMTLSVLARPCRPCSLSRSKPLVPRGSSHRCAYWHASHFYKKLPKTRPGTCQPSRSSHVPQSEGHRCETQRAG